jgi:hypothetical protein
LVSDKFHTVLSHSRMKSFALHECYPVMIGKAALVKW